jgi:cob(I)alamin adenosyltransferase
MSIYTKTGDGGETSLLGGVRKKKSETVFEVLGTLDELSSLLGFLHLTKIPHISKTIYAIQIDLLTIGSFVAGRKWDKNVQKIFEDKVVLLEKDIDQYDKPNKPLRNFLISGGCMEFCYLHFARAICRRLERRFVDYLKKSGPTNFAVFEKYFNRLADLLFVMARYANAKKGIKDIVWEGVKI